MRNRLVPTAPSGVVDCFLFGHEVTVLCNALPEQASDEAVPRFAYDHGCLLVTCNRDDFLALATTQLHHGIVIVIRRRTRAAERAALLRLLERAGPVGLQQNINFS